MVVSVPSNSPPSECPWDIARDESSSESHRGICKSRRLLPWAAMISAFPLATPLSYVSSRHHRATVSFRPSPWGIGGIYRKVPRIFASQRRPFPIKVGARHSAPQISNSPSLWAAVLSVHTAGPHNRSSKARFVRYHLRSIHQELIQTPDGTLHHRV